MSGNSSTSGIFEKLMRWMVFRVSRTADLPDWIGLNAPYKTAASGLSDPENSRKNARQ
jgi:hypothetical protein